MKGHISTLLSMTTNELIIETQTTNQRACPACQTPLDLHQPDETTPARLLGVCPNCHAWTLVRSIGRGRYALTLVSDPDRR